MTTETTVTRFAPSPTGHLHLGHAHSALFAARAAGPDGRFLLRIEDIDGGRSRPEFIDAILEDLAWLGLRWERPVRRQSEHLDDYRAALDRLSAMDLLYPCFCTRKEIEAEIEAAAAAPHDIPTTNIQTGPDGHLYPGTCRRMDAAERADRLAAEEAHALRLKIDVAMSRTGPLEWVERGIGKQTAKPEIFGDVVLARKDTPTSYHLAVTVDDALQGVTLVTRGRDLFAASHLHRLLQALLGLQVPEYQHHDLIAGEGGRRLAKRDRAATLRYLREAGKTPAEVRALAGFGDSA